MADAFSAFWQSSRHLSGLKINRPCGKVHLLLRDAAREEIQSASSIALAKTFIDRARAAISRRFAIRLRRIIPVLKNVLIPLRCARLVLSEAPQSLGAVAAMVFIAALIVATAFPALLRLC
jgi:hypothetical protein